MAAKVIDGTLIIPQRAYRFLVLQQGRLSPLHRDRIIWQKAYTAQLQEDYKLIAPHLPKLEPGIHHTLDVGSGIGGINVYISRHYKTEDVEMVPILMDGRKDEPTVVLHRKTFNDMRAAYEFHLANGGTIYEVDANERPLLWPLSDAKAKLVTSLASWCFHYPPDTYLDFVRANLAPEARLIIDVRRDKPEWRTQLLDTFRWRASIHGSNKFERMVFDATN
jgi:hypothetical protein